jgi:hypothetical protein
MFLLYYLNGWSLEFPLYILMRWRRPRNSKIRTLKWKPPEFPLYIRPRWRRPHSVRNSYVENIRIAFLVIMFIYMCKAAINMHLFILFYYFKYLLINIHTWERKKILLGQCATLLFHVRLVLNLAFACTVVGLNETLVEANVHIHPIE